MGGNISIEGLSLNFLKLSDLHFPPKKTLRQPTDACHRPGRQIAVNVEMYIGQKSKLHPAGEMLQWLAERVVLPTRWFMISLYEG